MKLEETDFYKERFSLGSSRLKVYYERYNKKEKYKFANLFKAKRKKLFKN